MVTVPVFYSYHGNTGRVNDVGDFLEEGRGYSKRINRVLVNLVEHKDKPCFVLLGGIDPGLNIGFIRIGVVVPIEARARR